VSTDVLAINNLRSNTAIIAANVTSNSASYTNTLKSLCTFVTNPQTSYNNWDGNLIPCAPTSGTVLCVYDNSSYFTGVCCAWTVPAGVTRARFEIWGAGGGTHPGCCCAFFPFGATGAYAVSCITVTPGWTYTLCAGQPYQCYLQQSYSGGASCPSYITGCGFCNFCALGAWSGNLICQNFENNRLCTAACYYYGSTSKGVYSYCGTSRCCFYCLCSYGEICASASANTGGIIPFKASLRGFYGTACNFSNATMSPVNGVPSLYSSVCATGGICCVCMIAAPVPGFVNTSMCCLTVNNGNMTANSFGSLFSGALGYLRIPGAGGWGVITAGGCNSNCGDVGRPGLVRVIYC